MTDLEGNRQIYLPREIQDCLPKSFARSIEIFGEVILNLKGQIDSLLPEGPSHYLFYYTIMLQGHLKKKNNILIGSLLDLPWC